MAVDSAAKRFSMLNFGDGTTIHLLFEVDGAVDLDDRQHLLDCYVGIAFEGPPVVPVVSTLTQLLVLGRARKVVDTATATGTDQSERFVLPTGSGQYGSLLILHAILNSVTVLVVDLEESLDEGVTFDPILTLDFFNLKVQDVEVSGGTGIYRLNIQEISGTSVDFWVSEA